MKTLIRLTAYGLRHKLLFFGAATLFIVAVFPYMVIPRLLGSAIDEALTSGLRSQIFALAGTILLMSLVRGALFYASLYLTSAAAQRVAYDLRKEFFDKLQGLSLGFHDKQQTGDLMSKATVDVEAVHFYIGFGFLGSFGNIATFLIAVAIMLLIDWRLGLICVSFVPVLIWLTAAMSVRVTPIFAGAHAETGKMNAVAQENLAGIRVAKAFGARDYESAKFQGRARAVADHFYSAEKIFVSRTSMITLLFAGATAAILLFGGQAVFSGRLTPGELVSFILYMGILAWPVQLLGWRVQTVSRAIAAGRRLFEVLDAESPVKEVPSATQLGRVRGHVKLDRVSLSYNTSAEALHDVDLEVLPGQTVAVLGGPGSGKSTAVHLLPRFYDVSSGRVLIDGVDVRDVTLESLRKNVGIVLQDVFAFSATIRDNIAYGVTEATQAEVVEACKAAQLHEFVESLPDGYDTWLGERGITLSGGQRQRLAIARTILLDPPILVLDDSTSSVDVGTETLIQRALADVAKGRTTIVIAHRLSTVRSADLILVLERGRVVESGSHEDLLKGDGFYRRIHDLQIRPQEEGRFLSSQPAVGGAS